MRHADSPMPQRRKMAPSLALVPKRVHKGYSSIPLAPSILPEQLSSAECGRASPSSTHRLVPQAPAACRHHPQLCQVPQACAAARQEEHRGLALLPHSVFSGVFSFSRVFRSASVCILSKCALVMGPDPIPAPAVKAHSFITHAHAPTAPHPSLPHHIPPTSEHVQPQRPRVQRAPGEGQAAQAQQLCSSTLLAMAHWMWERRAHEGSKKDAGMLTLALA